MKRSGGGRTPLRGLPRHLPGVSVSLHPPSRHPPGARAPLCQGQGVSKPFPASGPLLQVSALPQAAPGARQSPIYCLVSTVTRRRRQRLPSAAPTRRRDVCPPLPLCPYLERRCGWGKGWEPDSRGAPPPRSAPPPRGPAVPWSAHPSSYPDPAEAGGGSGRQHPWGSAGGGCSQSLGSGSSVLGG